MCIAGERLVVGTSGRNVNVYDLRQMGAPEQRRESSLKFQTRCIRAFIDNTGKWTKYTPKMLSTTTNEPQYAHTQHVHIQL